MIRIILLLLFIFYSLIPVYSQYQVFGRADSLRGSLNEWRSNFDVTYYELDLKVLPDKKFILGSNLIHFRTLKDLQMIQLDLFTNLSIDSIIHHNQVLTYDREGNTFWVHFPEKIRKGSLVNLKVYYSGYPVIAKNPPWDGGFVWSKDSSDQHWIGVSCQGMGASAWWPNKDHLSDEPDSMRIKCEVPESLICVSNGQFIKKEDLNNGFSQYEWLVTYPINNYNVSLNIADYAHLTDKYINKEGEVLSLDYYVLKRNKEKAKEHFEQVKPMLKIFEHYFGRYPFWNDGYKLVETPYWGMEHQSAIAYGNNYQNNEFGFDFIIVHESGHEYWGNSVSTADLGEMWIHESFTTYMEALLVEYRAGYQRSIDYLLTQKPLIENNMAISQPKGVNFNYWNDADMYYKGSWMLHTIRNIVDDDKKWFKLLFDLYQNHKLSIVSGQDIISFMNKHTGYNLNPVFDQYLNHPEPPILKYYLIEENNKLIFRYRWLSPVKDFNMPVKIYFDKEKYQWINPTSKWKTKKFVNKNSNDIKFATELFYFIAQEIDNSQ